MNTETPIDWAELQTLALGYRAEKGFLPATWEDAGTRLACIAAEIWEVEQELYTRSDKPNARPTLYELADVAGYILTLQHDLGFPAGTPRLAFHGGASRMSTPADATKPLRQYWSKTFEYWRKDKRSDAEISIEVLLAAVIDTHDRVLGATNSFPTTFKEKFVIMAERPHLHGGKRAST